MATKHQKTPLFDKFVALAKAITGRISLLEDLFVDFISKLFDRLRSLEVYQAVITHKSRLQEKCHRFPLATLVQAVATKMNRLSHFLISSLVFHILLFGFFSLDSCDLFPDRHLKYAVKVEMVDLPDKVESRRAKKLKSKKKKAKKKESKKSRRKKKMAVIKKSGSKKASTKEKQSKKSEELKKAATVTETASEPKKGNIIQDGVLGENADFQGLDKIKFDRYYGALKDKIYENWIIPSWVEGQLAAKVLIVIDSKGKLVRTRILEPSGNNVFDESALKAVKESAPFPEPSDRLKILFRGKEIELGFRR